MRRMIWLGALAACVLAAGPAQAQGVLPLAFEARGGFAMPMGDFGEGDEVETGVGFGVTGMFRVIPAVAVYAGWDQHSFPLNTEGATGVDEANVVDSGFSAGAQVSVPIGMLTGFSPWVRAGVLLREAELEIESDLGDFSEESDRSTGFEVGAGVTVPLGMIVSFTPGVIYRTYDPDFGEGDTDDEKISYLGISLGIKFSL